MLFKEDFNFKEQKTTGGQTGSVCVSDIKGQLYQFKPSILANPSLIRRLKAHDVDSENFGEVIASCVAQSLLGNTLVPEVSLVYDKAQGHLAVASKYLQGTHISTLDEFVIQELDKPFPSSVRHATFVSQKNAQSLAHEVDLNQTQIMPLKKSLAEALVLSAIIGDHDVNPGNMMVVTQSQTKQVARIDFGHAFNDLLSAPAILGGQLENKTYPVLDFFNRTSVAGIRAPSKLWRDYPGMIPSMEIVMALRDFHVQFREKIQLGIQGAHNEFLEAIKVLEQNHQHKSISHLRQSLLAICANIAPNNKNLAENASTKDIFKFMQTFLLNNGQHLMQVANVMELQIYLEQTLHTDAPDAKSLERINELLQENDFPRLGEKIQWIRTGINEPPFVGSVAQYITHQLIVSSPDSAAQKIPALIKCRESLSLNSTTGAFKKNLAQIKTPDSTALPRFDRLITQLKQYIETRLKEANGRGRFDKNHKILAALALIDTLKHQKKLNLEQHQPVLCEGRLGRIIQRYLKKEAKEMHLPNQVAEFLTYIQPESTNKIMCNNKTISR